MSTTPYTAPSDGYVTMYAQYGGTAYIDVDVGGISISAFGGQESGKSMTFVRKGTVMTVQVIYGNASASFIPLS